MSKRTDRVADLVRQELADILLRRVHDPRVRLASISQVEVTPDLKRATVGVSHLGSDEERQECLAALEHASGFLRSQLARRLRGMKCHPRLVFEIDRGPEYSRKIEDILEHLHEEHDSDPSS